MPMHASELTFQSWTPMHASELTFQSWTPLVGPLAACTIPYRPFGSQYHTGAN